MMGQKRRIHGRPLAMIDTVTEINVVPYLSLSKCSRHYNFCTKVIYVQSTPSSLKSVVADLTAVSHAYFLD